MIVIGWALIGAFAFGVSDFLGGLFSRRARGWSVAWCSQLAGLALALTLSLVLGGDPSPRDLAWGVLAGVGNALGVGALYQGLAVGRMGVVAPVSAVGAAFVPVAVGVGLGEQPGPGTWAAFALAAPAIWLVSSVPAEEGIPDREGGAGHGGLAYGVTAGIGFGIIFAALGQADPAAGTWPVVADLAVAVVLTPLVAGLSGIAWWPRQRAAWLGASSGLIAGTGTVCFLVATNVGELSVAGVLTSLYPAVTVAAAVLFLRERLARGQLFGVCLCVVVVALIAVRA